MPTRVILTMSDVKGMTRKERSERTRTAIVRAATEEFRATGYHGTTMAAIAKRAGVAVQTVYFVFHTKPILLTATIDAAVMGGDDPLPPELTPWWQEGTSTKVGRRAIELFVTNVAVIEERAAALDRVARAAATTDPDVVDVLAHHETLRVAGFRSYLESLSGRGLLRTGLELDEATDVLLTLAGSATFLELTEGRGWSVDRWVEWTTATLTGLLVEPSRRRRR
jgi:AcrR family transcriptional regulator